MSDPAVSMNDGMTSHFPSLASLRAAHSDLLKRRRDHLARHDDDGDDTLPPELFEEVEDFISRGRTIGALLDSDEDRWVSQSLLDYWATALYRVGRTPPEATLVDFDPEQAPELDDALCPYVGLYAFQEAHQQLFFGRQRLIEEMLGCLEHSRLLAVVGPSGSGKSSVVLAGLLPALKNSSRFAGTGRNAYPPMVPGSDPLLGLALMVMPSSTNPEQWIGQHHAEFKRDPEHLLHLVRAAKNAPVLIVVDQFEELFTLCSDDELVLAFVDNLLTLIKSEDHRHAVILTVRSDFEPHIARLRTLYPYFQQARVQVTPLSAAEVRDAIERPAELVGLKFEVGIVDDLVKEILGEPAGLPLLQFTLLELWKRRERNRITREAYHSLGGAREALTLTADRFYNDLIPQDQVTAKRILLRLARTSEGLEVLRNRVRRESLYKAGEARDQVDRVLEKLIAARLLRLQKGETPADDQVEMAHEALVRNWRRLVQWLDEERTSLRQRQRLTAAAEQWRLHGRDPGGLLGGSLLDEVMRYEDLNALETEFVRASRAEAERLRQEKEEAYRREIEQAQALAEAERQRAEAERQRYEEKRESNRRLRWFAAALAVMFLLAVGAALSAKKQTQRATRQAGIAEQQRRLAEDRVTLIQKQRRVAEQLRNLAEERTAEATEQRAKAAESASLAMEESRRAKQQQAEAMLQAEIARRERRKAEKVALQLQAALEAKQEAEKGAAKARSERVSVYRDPPPDPPR